MKYSFLFPYKNRVEQFHNTILSLEHWYGHRNDWEAIVILDGANEEVSIPSLENHFTICHVVRDGVNPAPLFNMAANMAKGEYLVISNPECFHVSDVLGWYDWVFEQNKNAYAVAACDAVKRVGQLEYYRDDIWEKVGVFQHSTKHNVLYHYCSAMHKSQWQELGGFDERFGEGYACEDDDFRDRVVCGNFVCFTDNSVKVLHQEHDKYKHTPEIRRRYQHNLALLNAGRKQRGYVHNVNKYKAR